MALPYVHREDIVKRLEATICMYDDEPYYVSTMDGRTAGNDVTIYRLDGNFRPTKTVDHTDEKFSDRSVPLGYIYFDSKAWYLTRVPLRTQNQAIQKHSIQSNPEGLNRNAARWFSSAAMKDCILGNHVSLKKAWVLLEDGVDSVPIHRYVAIGTKRNQYVLYYKGREVAYWNDKEDYWSYFKGEDTSFIQRSIERLGVL